MYRLYGLRPRRAELGERATRSFRERKGLRRSSALSPEHMRSARVFYGEMLGGRWIRPPIVESGAFCGSWFAVGGVRVEARADLGSRAAPILLHVDDPDALAQRCWDAGFTVRVRQDETGRAPVSVIDPFGRRIDLAPRVDPTSQRLRAS